MTYLENDIPAVAYNGLKTKKAVDFSTKLGIKSLTSTEITTVDTSAKRPVGSRGRDASGNEYIYLPGVASVAAGTWVSFDENFVTARLTSNAVGSVAIAMAATVAGRWGWFQIYGKGAGAIGNTVSGDKALYISSVTGSVDDLLVTGDKIIGALSRSTGTVTGSTIDVQLNYPFVDDSTT